MQIHSKYSNTFRRQRPYHVENTASRPISEVKQRRVWSVLGWVTAWEHQMLLAFIFFYINVLLLRCDYEQFLKNINTSFFTRCQLVYSRYKYIPMFQYFSHIVKIYSKTSESNLYYLYTVQTNPSRHGGISFK